MQDLERKQRDEQEYRKAMQENAPYLTLGIQLAMTIGIGALIGYWIEGKSGIGMGIGAGIGAVLGMAYFLKTVLTLEAKQQRSQKKQNDNFSEKSETK